MYASTIHAEWKVLGHARSQVEALSTHAQGAASYTVNQSFLGWGATWATTDVPHCAQSPANFPGHSNVGLVDERFNFICLRFLVATVDTDDDNEQITGTLWGWDDHGNAPFELLIFNPIQAGTSICQSLASAQFQGGSTLHLPFNSGGTEPIRLGDTIEGETSGATGVVSKIVKTSGNWANGNAAGAVFMTGITGTWQAEQINNTTLSVDNVGTSTAALARFQYADVVTITTDNIGYEYEGQGSDNKVRGLRAIDVRGLKHLFFDFDCDAGSGTDALDGIVLYKGY